MKKKLTSILLVFALVFTFTAAGTFSTFAFSKACKEYAGKIVILHSNDVHGAVEGYQYMAGLKSQYEAKGAEVILADAGDYSQGTVYVSSSKGASAVDLMNAAGYDVATLGNHELDYGYPQLVQNLSKAEFEVLCADVFRRGSTIYPASTIITKGKVKIGFFGLETPEAQTKTNPALTKGLIFLDGKNLTECARDTAAELRENGADIVIALVHLGVDGESAPYRSVDLFKDTAAMGVDMVIDGHSHTVMTQGENGEAIQSTGTAFENVGVIIIDKKTKKIEKNELVALKDADGNYVVKADKAVKKVADCIIKKVDKDYGEVFAKSEVTLNGAKAPNGNRDSETNNGDLIADAMLWSVKSTGGITDVDANHIVAITNGGGIRAAINPGDVSKKDINTVLPFGNTVAVVYVTGAELLESLEASTYCTPEAVGAFPQIAGMDIVINVNAKYDAQSATYPGSTYYGPKTINRVTIKSVNGEEFDEDALYAVVTNNFCAAGGDTYYAFASAKTQFDTGIPLDEAVMDYVKTELGGVIGAAYAEPQGRISMLDVVLAQPVVKLTKAKASVTAKWAADANAEGYDVVYAKNKNFNSAKTLTVKTNKATVKKLKAGKYFVKVRSFKEESGIMCYSDWSAVKNIQVK